MWRRAPLSERDCFPQAPLPESSCISIWAGISDGVEKPCIYMLFLLSAVFYKGLFVYPNNTKIASGILSNHSLPQNNTKIPHTYIITSMITMNFRQKATSEVAKTDSQKSLVFQGIICQQIQRFLQCPARDLFRIHPTEEKYTPGSVSGSPLLPPAPSIKHFRCNV